VASVKLLPRGAIPPRALVLIIIDELGARRDFLDRIYEDSIILYDRFAVGIA